MPPATGCGSALVPFWLQRDMEGIAGYAWPRLSPKLSCWWSGGRKKKVCNQGKWVGRCVRQHASSRIPHPLQTHTHTLTHQSLSRITQQEAESGELCKFTRNRVLNECVELIKRVIMGTRLHEDALKLLMPIDITHTHTSLMIYHCDIPERLGKYE